MQADSWWDRATWAYRVRWVVFTCDTVLLVAVRIAVTRWQPDTLHDVLVLSSLDLPGTQSRFAAFDLRRDPQCATGAR